MSPPEDADLPEAPPAPAETLGEPAQELGEPDAEERIGLLLRDLRSSRDGLTARQAQRRLAQFGPNELTRRAGLRWPRELARQVTHPLALLLWLAAALSFAVGSSTVAIAVLLVIALNAGFAFVQEQQAERAVEALAAYMPQHVTVMRDGAPRTLEARLLVPGDIVLVAEGERIAADMRMLDGSLQVDASPLTGESAPVVRAAELHDPRAPRTTAPDLLFNGTTAISGEARAIVYATGMHTELGRIAALSERVKEEPSPLERQVRRVAWLIAAIAVTMAVAFVPLAIFVAGLSLRHSVVFAVGLLAGNVPEGLLPVITLALAVAVGALARRGALVKRLSAVETLGSTDVICTDKTGTLTENKMRPRSAWTLAGEVAVDADGVVAGARDAGAESVDPGGAASADAPTAPGAPAAAALAALAETAARCSEARVQPGREATGDPTEIAILRAAAGLGADIDPQRREASRRHVFAFDPRLELMSTLDATGDGTALHTKGAPESVLGACATALDGEGVQRPLTPELTASIRARFEESARDGLRVLGFARRALGPEPAQERGRLERDLCFLGLIAMRDPPRPEVADAVARCHEAGIRVLVITGDHPLTAAAIARQVGIGDRGGLALIDARGMDHRHARAIRRAVEGEQEVVFARASPEMKLQIADALRERGHVVAMTGDGVNDAPALRSADIGVAMGRSGTDVAREAATMVLTDDNFASIVAAVEAGRQVYDNVRKFIVYIFAHATPEVVPFLVFALAGGRIPLPLPVLLLLAFDVGTETLPSLALGRDPASPLNMSRPPRPRGENVIRKPMLLRAWLFLGALVAALSLGCFFAVLDGAGWHEGASVAAGTRFHHAYLQATTMTFLGMIAGQIGTAFAVHGEGSPRTLATLRSNPQLLLAVVAELALAALIVYAPPLQSLLGTAAPPPRYLLLLLPLPLIVWGAEQLRAGLGASLARARIRAL